MPRRELDYDGHTYTNPHRHRAIGVLAAIAAPTNVIAQDPDIRNKDAASEEEWAYSVGVQNYVFGLPLTIFERERKLRLDPVALEKAKKFAPAAPINQLGHMKGLATADYIMPYTPNNDTVYSGALLELAEEPVILTVPEILDRYWLVEVADCYTENLFYIGMRATGGKAGNHAFVGPNWKGKLPEGVIEHRVPYNSLMFALRIGVIPGDDADLKKVLGLQEEFALTSLSNWGDPKKFGKAGVPKLAQRPDYKGELAFYQTLADLLTENPPAKKHAAAVVLLRRGGIVVGQPFDPAKSDEPTRKGMARAALIAPQVMKWKVKYRGTSYPTRWNNLRPGNYGVDYLTALPVPSKDYSCMTVRRRFISAPMKTVTPNCSTGKTAISFISTRMRFPRCLRTGFGPSPCTERISSW